MICQSNLPYDATRRPALPGVAPLKPEEWLHVDDAYAAQMAERLRLLRSQRDSVLWMDTSAQQAAEELLLMALKHCPDGFAVTDDQVTCPDGRVVALSLDDPLGTLGQIFQEDFCLMIKQGNEHALMGAVLCFPASWTLSEKAGKGLFAVHGPVDVYDGLLARRVQRLFDGVRAGKPLWRFNALWYDDPALYQPRSALAPREAPPAHEGGYFRSERQCILRLPETGAAVFSIHTYQVTRASYDAQFGSG